jgi:hypothetical protein
MSSSSELNKAKPPKVLVLPCGTVLLGWSRTRPRPRDVTVFALATVPSVAACSSFARVSVRWGLGLAPAGIRSGHGTALVCRPSAPRRQSPCQTSIFGNDRSNPRLSVSSPTSKIRTGFVALLLVGTSDAFGWWLDILMRGKRSFRFAWFGEGGRLSNAPGMNEKK